MNLIAVELAHVCPSRTITEMNVQEWVREALIAEHSLDFDHLVIQKYLQCKFSKQPYDFLNMY